MEPVVGVEPTTDGLQNRCSTTELNWLPKVPSGNHYALLKRGGKQFRHSSKTADRALAQRRLSALRDQVNNRTLTSEKNAKFADVAKAWLETQTPALKPSSLTRRKVCISGLVASFLRCGAKPRTSLKGSAAKAERFLKRRITSAADARPDQPHQQIPTLKRSVPDLGCTVRRSHAIVNCVNDADE